MESTPAFKSSGSQQDSPAGEDSEDQVKSSDKSTKLDASHASNQTGLLEGLSQAKGKSQAATELDSDTKHVEVKSKLRKYDGLTGSEVGATGHDQRSKRYRKLTEKGRALQVESNIHLLKSRISKFKSAAIEADRLISDCENVVELRYGRDNIAASLGQVCEALNTLNSKLSPDEFGEYEQRVERLKNRNLDLMAGLSERITYIERERSSQASDHPSVSRSHRSHHSSVSRTHRSHHSSVTMSRSSASSRRSSKGSHHSSVSEIRAGLAAEAAALQTRMKYLEAEAEQAAYLDKLRTTMQLEETNARLLALSRFGEMNDKLPQQAEFDPVQPRQKVEQPIVVRPAKQRNLPAAAARVKTPQSGLNSQAEEFVPRQVKQEGAHDLEAIMKMFADQVQVGRYPVPEPGIFTGEIMQYPSWKTAFSILIDRKNIPEAEKVYYLSKYLDGPAKQAVSGYLHLPTEEAFQSAKLLLDKRYGDPYCVANAYRDKLDAWPKIMLNDGYALRDLADFLQQCAVAMNSNPSLSILDDERETKKLLLKLPRTVTERWNRSKVAPYKQKHGKYPPFSDFVEFMTTEGEFACDPVSSAQALSSSKPEVKTSNSAEDKWKTSRSSGAKKSRALSTQSQPTSQSLSTSQTQSTPQNKVKPAPKPCIMCGALHSLDDCGKFLGMALPDRKKYAMSKHLCFGCLKQGEHISKDCLAKKTCKTCGRRHPTSLHGDIPAKPDSDEKRKPEVKSEAPKPSVKSVHSAFCGSHSRTSKLSTLIIPVVLSHEDNPEVEVTVYAMMDLQSDANFILPNTCRSLGISGPEIQLWLSTLTAKDELVDSQLIGGLRVRGIGLNDQVQLTRTYTRDVMPTNRAHIPRREDLKQWPHLQQIADEIAPMLDCEVGLLIGYEDSDAWEPHEVIRCAGKGPYGHRTILGWGVVGALGPSEQDGDHIGVSHRIMAREVDMVQDGAHVVLRTTVKERKVNSFRPADISQMMALDFSEYQSGPQYASMEKASQEDLKFLEIVSEGIHVTNGHYEMPLPLRSAGVHLPDNKVAASKRLDQLGRKLKKNPTLHADYTKFMDNMIQKGHAEEVPSDDSTVDGKVWYIPHHGIYHPKKPTKLRVVFDCSAQYGGQSLNQNLLQGPDMTNRLVGVLIRFRCEPIAVTCDIEAMFHQFLVNQEHRDLLRFLWWKRGDLSTTPAVFRMCVHLFGAVSSPACANYALKQTAEDHAAEFSPETVSFIKDDFYVDDGLKSLPDVESAIKLVETSQALCQKRGLRLHKFTSNNKDVLDSVPKEDRAEKVSKLDLMLDDLPADRALGVHWCVQSDTLGFRITLQDQPLTRRGILSTVSSIYDPLGLVAPFVLTGKQVLQDICREGLDWDAPLSDELRQRWELWRSQIVQLEELQVPRCFKPADFGSAETAEIHHFSDASFVGYGCCSFLRQKNAQGVVHCSLIAGKSRVTPLKTTTVPRLELTAAVTSVRMSQLLQRELRMDIQHIFWTDSQVVLGYIANVTSRYHVFVANRIQVIRDVSSPEQWNHVRTEHNPADLASRGCTAKDICQGPSSSLWFNGPSFLWEPELPSRQQLDPAPPEDPEIRKRAMMTECYKVPRSVVLEQLQRFTSWNKMRKVVAMCKNLKKILTGAMKHDEISATDLQQAETTIVRLTQQESFGEDMQSLKAQDMKVKKTSDLVKLDPFIDDQGLLRVGGRIRTSSLPFSVKHPLLLPKDHHVSRAILRHFHRHTAHQGRGMTINELRSNGFWVISASKSVARIISHCVTCRKLRGRNVGQKMADLPKERVQPAPPFTYSGMDLFGPFFIKEGRKELKRWGCVFTCLASRAIHLEVTTAPSTDAFLNTLRRFISLRGAVKQLRCDQGTNFVGARRELKDALQELDNQHIHQYLAEHQIEFVFNPPHASHMGGVWERQIRTVRSILECLLKEHGPLLDDDSLRTLMAETASIVNSRPLSVENLTDPTCVTPLTPNHLLTGRTAVILPPPGDFQRADLYCRKRWRRVQHLANSFWSRWKKEYVQQLQHRQKWSNPQRNLRKGDIVMVTDDNLPRGQWRLGRVVEAQPDQDGRVRRVQVIQGDPMLNKKGQRVNPESKLERPVHKLVLILEAPEQ